MAAGQEAKDRNPDRGGRGHLRRRRQHAGKDRPAEDCEVRAGFNQAGDSVLIPPGGKAKVKITSAGPLYYICAIHPWMLGAVNAKAPR